MSFFMHLNNMNGRKLYYSASCFFVVVGKKYNILLLKAKTRARLPVFKIWLC